MLCYNTRSLIVSYLSHLVPLCSLTLTRLLPHTRLLTLTHPLPLLFLRCSACGKQLLPGDEFALREDGLYCRHDFDVFEKKANAENNNTTNINHNELKGKWTLQFGSKVVSGFCLAHRFIFSPYFPKRLFSPIVQRRYPP